MHRASLCPSPVHGQAVAQCTQPKASPSWKDRWRSMLGTPNRGNNAIPPAASAKDNSSARAMILLSELPNVNGLSPRGMEEYARPPGNEAGELCQRSSRSSARAICAHSAPRRMPTARKRSWRRSRRTPHNLHKHQIVRTLRAQDVAGGAPTPWLSAALSFRTPAPANVFKCVPLAHRKTAPPRMIACHTCFSKSVSASRTASRPALAAPRRAHPQ